MKKIIVIGAVFFVSGCATELTQQATNVKTISIDNKANCKFLGLITSTKTIGPDKQNNAMKKAYNDVAERGGNALYVISSSIDWAEGAAVTGEAYSCK